MAFTHKKFVVRSKVIWIGPPENTTEFSNRQLSVEYCDESSASSHLPFATALVINVVTSNRGNLAAVIRSLAEEALDHGLAVHVIADSDETQNHIAHVLRTFSMSGRLIASTRPALHTLAERIARHEAGPSWSVDLGFRGEPLDSVAELLLRRAFCDCKYIIVKRLTGGMTSNVLSVYAVFKDSRSGPRPLPFFAKVGPRQSIEEEQEIYRMYVEHFIPFYLRPSLDYDRCVFGFRDAVLVGNFVEYSEPLSEVARRGIAQPVIHSLFDNALRGWRLQATEVKGNLLSAMSGYVNPDEIPASRLVQARRDGATRTAHELEALLQKANDVAYLSAPYHGDLHAVNICVRGADAILIDFQRVRLGPLLADHACLEISLAFNEFENDSNDGWKELIDTLYSKGYFIRPPGPPLEPAPREWLWNAVRQIRTISLANQQSPNEYLQIVVTCLLRFARLPKRPTDTPIAEARKAYAYTIADRLINVIAENA
jgi:hypothetical protein